VSKSDEEFPILERPLSADGGERFAYRRPVQLVISLFIVFHALVLLVHNLPSKGLSAGLHRKFNKHLKASVYMRTVGSTQSWAMFAPNPHRQNTFTKVMVEDQDGEVWDMKHDIYRAREHPYLFYDRMGKVNRRLLEQKGYQRAYAAWVCREWERDHKGVPAKEVRIVKMWTRVPPPGKAMKKGGFDPNKLKLHQKREQEYSCKSTLQAQLPPYLERRYGLPESAEKRFRKVSIRTWHDQQQSKERREGRDA
jgi:hypothetical protein